MSPPNPLQLARALRELEPRSRQVLTWRYVQRLPSARCAERLGISEAALRIHLTRALRALDAALTSSTLELVSDEEEERLSRLVEQSPAELTEAGARRLAELAQALERQAEAIAKEQRAAELAAETSPARAREDLLRRLAIIALIALAGFFYWRNEVAGSSAPRTPARDVRPR